MRFKLTLSGDVDSIAKLSRFRLTPVHSTNVLWCMGVACGSSHCFPVGTKCHIAIFIKLHYFPTSRVSITLQCHRILDEVLHSVRTHCERRCWVKIWKWTCKKNVIKQTVQQTVPWFYCVFNHVRCWRIETRCQTNRGKQRE